MRTVWAVPIIASILILGTLALFQDAEAQPTLIASSPVSFGEGLAVDSAGNVWVAENQSGEFIKFDNDLLSQITVLAGFSLPVYVAVDSADNVYVTDQRRGTVTKFSSTGTLLLPPATGLTIPKAVAVDSSGNVYVVELGAFPFANSKVTKFTNFPTGRTTFVTGLNIPLGIAFDSSGNVYVSESGVGIVNKFSSTGTPLESLGGFDNPSGIAFDSSGNFYVNESNAGTIHKFTNFPGGQSTFLTGLISPQGIGFDSSNNFFVIVHGFSGSVNKYAPAVVLTDDDDDGFFAEVDDCNDADNTIFPGAPELDDGKDNDCDGTIDEGLDADGDTFTPTFGGDCNDADNTIFPGALEVFNGIDDNCDGNIDEGITPQEGTETVISDIQDLVDSDALNGGQGNSLTSKLENIIEKLDKGKTKPACNQLGAFVNQVQSFIDDGILSTSEGQPLLDKANLLISNVC